MQPLPQQRFAGRRNRGYKCTTRRLLRDAAEVTPAGHISPFHSPYDDVFVTQGKYDEADRLYERAVDTLENGLGLDHPRVADVLDLRASLRKAQVMQHASAYFPSLPYVLQRVLGVGTTCHPCSLLFLKSHGTAAVGPSRSGLQSVDHRIECFLTDGIWELTVTTVRASLSVFTAVLCRN